MNKLSANFAKGLLVSDGLRLPTGEEKCQQYKL